MKKLSVHLSLLCLLAFLLVPFAGCKKEETEEETPATTTDTTMSTSTSTETSTSMGTDMGTGSSMGSDMGTGSSMGTDMTTSSPMGSDTTQPPAGKYAATLRWSARALAPAGALLVSSPEYSPE
jgi:hypothetical protein